MVHTHPEKDFITQSHPATPSQKKPIIPHTHPEKDFIRSHPKILMVHTFSEWVLLVKLFFLGT